MTEKDFVPAAVVFLHAICGDTDGTKKFAYRESSPRMIESIQTDGKFDAKKAEQTQVFFCKPESAEVFEKIFSSSKAEWIETVLVVKIEEKHDDVPAKGKRIAAFFYRPEDNMKIRSAIKEAKENCDNGEVDVDTIESLSAKKEKNIIAFRKLTGTEIEYVRRKASFPFSVITERNAVSAEDMYNLYVLSDSLLKAQDLIKEAVFIWSGRNVCASSSEKKCYEIMNAVVDTSKSIIAMNTSGNGEYSYITKDGASVRVALDETVEVGYIPRSADGFDQKVFDVISSYYRPDYCDAREYEQTQKLPDIVQANEIEVEEDRTADLTSEKVMQSLSSLFLSGVTRILYIKKTLETQLQSEKCPELIDLGDAYRQIPIDLAQKVINSLNSLYNYSAIEENTDTDKTSRRKFFTSYLALNYLRDDNRKDVEDRLNAALSESGFGSLSKKDEAEIRKKIIDSAKTLSMNRVAAYDRNAKIRDDLEKQRAREEEFGRVL